MNLVTAPLTFMGLWFYFVCDEGRHYRLLGWTFVVSLVLFALALRAVNYILGTHPVSSTSYVAGVGTVSKTKTYSNNRGDNSYIPGAVIPGYIIIKPDFPECIDDYGFLWCEDEAVVAGSASWVVAGNAAEAIVKESK